MNFTSGRTKNIGKPKFLVIVKILNVQQQKTTPTHTDRRNVLTTNDPVASMLFTWHRFCDDDVATPTACTLGTALGLFRIQVR